MIRTAGSVAHPIPSRLNATILLVQVVLFAVCVGVGARLSFGWPLAALAVCFGVLLNSVYSVVHEAEHAMLFPNRRVNDLAGTAMALLFPAPFHLLRQGHLGHHLRNRSDDEAFDLYFDGDNVLWKWMVWIGILTGLYYVMVVLSNPILAVFPRLLDRRRYLVERDVPVDRASAAFLEAFNAAQLRVIQLEAIAVILLHAAIIWLLGMPLLNYVLMYSAFGLMWSAMQYVHHYGTERHVTRGARNLWIWGPLDLLWMNHNWHRAHHEHPTVPWVHLPRLDDSDGHRSRGFLPLHYLRMWRGPRRTDVHVANKYAGRIIQ